MKEKGFTLVELLIVISIIATLAMVAAPKAIESKLLSKLTQVSQDERLIQSALDAYFQDYGGYPRDHDAAWPAAIAGEQDGYTQLTSPIRYLTRILKDPFANPNAHRPSTSIEGGSGSDELNRYGNHLYTCGIGSSSKALYRYPERRMWGSADCIHAYLIIGVGPNQNDDTFGNDGFPYETQLYSYSPTNGTESYGDIYRLTGQYRRGKVIMDGVLLK